LSGIGEMPSRKLPQGQNDKDFCMLHFLEVERRHYLLNHNELADETLAGSLFISISEAYQVWGIILSGIGEMPSRHATTRTK
jgi:hypothetical protein